jgi:hypothetical protein
MKLNEGFQVNDLALVISPHFHIDEYKSKIDTDDKMCVLSFEVTDRNAASDLVNFIERGYKFVLDADVATDAIDDGGWIVFVEIRRLKTLYDHILRILSDLRGATGFKVGTWTFKYRKDKQEYPFNRETFESMVPTTARRYRKKYEAPIKQMKINAGIPVKDEKIDDPEIKDIQKLAGF